MPCGGDSIIESVQLVGLYLWMHDPARRAVTNSGTCDSSRHRVGGAVAFWRNRDNDTRWNSAYFGQQRTRRTSWVASAVYRS